jgi:hypothetical protein
MAYLRPPAFVRLIFNPLSNWFGIAGAETVVVTGRRTGEPRKAPVRPLSFDDARYLVSTYGEADWRAAGGEGQLHRGGTVRPFQAVEVPVGERPEIIDAYCNTSNRFVKSYFAKLPDPADHPIFRIVNAGDAPTASGG